MLGTDYGSSALLQQVGCDACRRPANDDPRPGAGPARRGQGISGDGGRTTEGWVDRMTEPWQEMLSDDQRRLFNAACGDLSRCMKWHGFRLSKDDWRHFIAGTILGWRMLPGIDRGEGAPGFVMLGGSSLDLTKAQCAEAITLAFAIGDQ